MKKLLLAGLALMIVLGACELGNRDYYLDEDDFGDPTEGAVVIVLNGSALPTKTITPGTDMDVSRYDLTFTGPNAGDYFIGQTGSDGLFSQTGLAQGTWNLEVDAYNNTPSPGPDLIGAIDGVVDSTVEINIAPGQWNVVSVDVLPIAGLGDLRVYIQWPDAAGVNEALTSSLTKEDGTPVANFATDFEISTSGTDRIAEYDTLNDLDLPQINSGYYLMILQIYDGGELLWGWVEAVRILAGQYTNTTDQSPSKFILDTLEGSGGINLSAFMQIVIGFSPDPSVDPISITQGEDFTITAQPIPAVPPVDHTYEYQWYIDGDVISGETSAALTDYGSLLTPDIYNIFVVLKEKDDLSNVVTISSNGFELTVNAP